MASGFRRMVGYEKQSEKLVPRLDILDQALLEAGKPAVLVDTYNKLVQLEGPRDILHSLDMAYYESVRPRDPSKAIISGDGSLLSDGDRKTLTDAVREVNPKLPSQVIKDIVSAFDNSSREVFREGWSAENLGKIKPSASELRAAKITKPSAMDPAPQDDGYRTSYTAAELNARNEAKRRALTKS